MAPSTTSPSWIREAADVLTTARSNQPRAGRQTAEQRSFRGKGLENAWRATAFAELAEAATGGCRPILEATLSRWENGCRAAGDALIRALKAVPGFAPAVDRLNEFAPYPEVWAAPVDELRHLDLARRDSTIPPDRRVVLERSATLLATELVSGTELEHRVRDAQGVWNDGERAWLRAVGLGIDGKGREALDHLKTAATQATGEHNEWLARDVAWAGDSVDLVEWQAQQPGPERAEWLYRFWVSRDEASARPYGARWVEHVRRYRHVTANYRSFAGGQSLSRPLLHVNTFPGCNALSAEGLSARHRRDGLFGHTVIDMRGSIYMRHGEPSQKVNFAGGLSQLDNEAWLYNLPDGPLIAVFCKPQIALNEMIAQPIAAGPLYESLCQLAAFYCVLDAQTSLGGVSPERLTRLKEQGRNQYERLETSDSYDQRFDKALPSALQIIGMSGATPSVLTAIELSAKTFGVTGRLDLHWQVFITAPDGRRVAEADTIKSYTLPADGTVLTAAHSVQVPAGSYTVTTIVSTADSVQGAAIRRREVTVLSNASAPGISDVTIYSPVPNGLRGTIAGEAVYLLPSLLTGRAGRNVGVGFVARGLAGAPIRVEIAVRRQGSAASAAPDVAIAFTETPTSAWEWRGRELSLEKLDSGSYDLMLSVTLPSGEIVRRTHQLILR
ncbi:MAG: hypothetical protein H0W15_04080 [Gemmatimonadales bacterium]|nr:hypothetical protein [Gemmatimonadales bacterium]